MLKMQLKIICAITYLFWKPCLKVIFRLRHSFHFIGRGWISLRLISLVFFLSASFSHGLWNGGLKRHLDFASLMFFLCTHPPLSRDLPLPASFLWGPQSRAKSHIFAVRRFCSSLVAEYPGYATRSAHSAARSWLWGCVCILPPLRISRFLKPLFVVWWGFPLHILCFPAVRLAQVPASPWGQFLAPFAHRSRTPGHFCLQFLLHFDFVFDSWRYLIFFFLIRHTHKTVFILYVFLLFGAGVVIWKGHQMHELVIKSWLKDLVFLNHFHLNSHLTLLGDIESLCIPAILAFFQFLALNLPLSLFLELNLSLSFVSQSLPIKSWGTMCLCVDILISFDLCKSLLLWRRKWLRPAY